MILLFQLSEILLEAEQVAIVNPVPRIYFGISASVVTTISLLYFQILFLPPGQ